MWNNLILAGFLICSLLAGQASGQMAFRENRLRSSNSGDHRSSDSANAKSTPLFDLSTIDEAVIEEFKKAWEVSGNGNWNVEGLVLIYRNADGSYRAASLGTTNEDRKFTFRWEPDAIAIVHTHPNDRAPKPDEMDKRVADKLGVPIFTITGRGMYMYDPITRETIKVKNGLDWLDPSAWIK